MTVLKRREEFKEKRINRKNRAKSRDNFLLRISHGINPSFKWYTKKFLFPSAKLIKKKEERKDKRKFEFGQRCFEFNRFLKNSSLEGKWRLS